METLSLSSLLCTQASAASQHHGAATSPAWSSSAARATPAPGSLLAAWPTPAPGSLSAAQPTPAPGSLSAARLTPASGPLLAVLAYANPEISGSQSIAPSTSVASELRQSPVPELQLSTVPVLLQPLTVLQRSPVSLAPLTSCSALLSQTSSSVTLLLGWPPEGVRLRRRLPEGLLLCLRPAPRPPA